MPSRLRLGLSLLMSLPCLSLSGCNDSHPVAWPPVVGQPFPDLQLLDHNGETVSLASFKGKVLLIEPVGMSCPGCIAFCGGHEYGAFRGQPPQQNLSSLDVYYRRCTSGLDLEDEQVAVIQVLFFNLTMETPTVAEARQWAKHFQIDKKPNHYVLIGPAALREASYSSIPGYWLVDRDFGLCFDSTGHHPKDNLYRDLLPAVSGLLQAGG